MYDTVYSVFTDALNREGKIITSYSDGTSYKVIFRKNSDTNKLRNTVTIFYNTNTAIHTGQLLKYKDKTYLAINQETPENDVYYKSDLIQTNATMNYIVESKEYNIPVYSYDVQDALTQNNNVLSIVNGNITLLVEDNSDTRALNIGDYFYALGGYWQINNLIYKDNLIYIYAQRELTNITYTVTITADDSYDRGTKTQFTAIAKANNTVITNANIVWLSSNPEIATVDANGNITFLADGNVDISATWKEHNVTAIKSITVTEPPVYGLIITCEDTYATTDTPTLIATATINGTADTTATITWASSDETIATIDNTGLVTFLATGDVTFTATWVEHNITATKNITVTTPVPTTQYTCKITDTHGTAYDDENNLLKPKVGSKKVIDSRFYDNTGAEVTTLTPEWSIDISNLPTELQNEINLTYNSDYPTRAYLDIDYDNSLIGYTFTVTLKASNDDTVIPYTVTALITSMYG
ncbi:MAG: Ig domain-containing protein [Oscillospiraceae bacterium]|jgi:uncharacterized protein YjdB